MVKLKKQFNILVSMSLVCIFNLVMIGTLYYYNDSISIYGQTSDLKNNTTKQVQVGDINMSYTIRGEGDPILLIMGYSGSKNDWDPTFLDRLSANHKVVVFDNRGVSNRTLGKNYTINQLAADAKGLLDVLNITKVDILGYSMGGMIAQELTLQHKDKVDDLIIYASYCGTKNQTYVPPDELLLQFGDINGTEDEIKKRFVPYQFPKDWMEQNTEKYDKIFSSFKLPSKETLQKQQKAMFDWIDKGGSCERLKDIQQDTLIIAGTADKVIPSINSEILKDKIERAQLETFVGGGHALMFQFPERLSKVINTFLDK